ncbi:MAG TPA: FAD-dependent oxidoreductase [Candidatus Omnitrophota bacterium]|nr:FAD-dependent oxidoreductase [Candidatus Omnitrophota bacterium]HPD83856.1 FAD-dependent oxidoreductase [Candidatus Omnitrophota bacterium]HRZ02713.1 FAD-dependent oxidoreductase [Candidatus Omnitrophota bacterium]
MITAQPPNKRIKNFSEVSLGLSKKQAIDEAMRCPQPANLAGPQGCPLGIDVFGFVRRIREGDVNGACQKIREHNSFPSICGRICSAPCESAGILSKENISIDIRALERYAVDHGPKRSFKKDSAQAAAKKVAIIGCGLTGLTAAAELAKLGYGVTIFESLHFTGGFLRYGAPEFRLPQNILNQEIDAVRAMGVDIKTDCFIGQTYSIKEIFDFGFAAIYLAAGQVPESLEIPGENLKRVYTAHEFLMRLNLLQGAKNPRQASLLDLGNKIAVSGCSDTAVDCARILIRLGKQAAVVYEGTEDTMTAQKREVQLAKEEGVKFELFSRPVEIIAGTGNSVKGLKCIRMDFAESYVPGQWALIPVDGSEFLTDADTVIVAGNLKPNSFIAKMTPELKTHETGAILSDRHTFMTSIPGVFAGRVIEGPHALVENMAQAKKIAGQIDQHLKGKV